MASGSIRFLGEGHYAEVYRPVTADSWLAMDRRQRLSGIFAELRLETAWGGLGARFGAFACAAHDASIIFGFDLRIRDSNSPFDPTSGRLYYASPIS